MWWQKRVQVCDVISFATGAGLAESTCRIKGSVKLYNACNQCDRDLPIIARKALKLGKTQWHYVTLASLVCLILVHERYTRLTTFWAISVAKNLERNQGAVRLERTSHVPSPAPCKGGPQPLGALACEALLK